MGSCCSLCFFIVYSSGLWTKCVSCFLKGEGTVYNFCEGNGRHIFPVGRFPYVLLRHSCCTALRPLTSASPGTKVAPTTNLDHSWSAPVARRCRECWRCWSTSGGGARGRGISPFSPGEFFTSGPVGKPRIETSPAKLVGSPALYTENMIFFCRSVYQGEKDRPLASFDRFQCDTTTIEKLLDPAELVDETAELPCDGLPSARWVGLIKKFWRDSKQSHLYLFKTTAISRKITGHENRPTFTFCPLRVCQD